MRALSFIFLVTCFAWFWWSRQPVNIGPEFSEIARMQPPTGYKAVAYFVNWAIYGRNHQPQDIPADKLTHVLYAFANVRPETGEVYLSDPWSDTDKVLTHGIQTYIKLFLLKKRHRHLKVLLSIGGWTYSSNFAGPASSTSGRETFAKSAVTLVKDLGFDGLDIDWEYPKNDIEAHNFTLLLAETRRALDRLSVAANQEGRMILTIACPAGSQNYKQLPLEQMDPHLDFWNLMAYDYAGSWDQISGHQANLYPSTNVPASSPFSTSAALAYYTSHGVHPSKIVLGMPLYGRAFIDTDGLGKRFSGVGEGSWEQGIWDFKALPHAGAEERYDENAGATYSYDPERRMLVSYDTKDMAREKAEFVKKEGLGGAMWWEGVTLNSACLTGLINLAAQQTSGDRSGEGSLISAVVESFDDMDCSRNTLSYPESKYDNLRNGFPGEEAQHGNDS